MAPSDVAVVDISSGSDSEDTSPPPPKKRKFRLGEELYKEVQSGALLDVILTVGSTKLYVHRTVIKVASDIFKDKLAKKLGVCEEGDPRRGIIDLPKGTSVKAAKAFIKFMYLGELGHRRIGVKKLLDVISLCDQFLVKDLLDTCITSTMGVIDDNNCVKICEASLQMKRCKRLSDAAFFCVARNICELSDETWRTISFKLWKKILKLEGPDIVDFSEEELFQKLLMWGQQGTSRKEEFKLLLPLIRFPLMTLSTISEVVKPSGVLTETDLIDLLCYIIGAGPKGSSIPRFPTHSRKSKIAKNSTELLSLLKTAAPGDFIQLLAGEYVGPFIIPSKLTLKGAGVGTVLTASAELEECFPILKIKKHESDVRISDLQIIAQLPNSPYGSQLGLHVAGIRNVLSNVSLENCRFVLSGFRNSINHISSENAHIGLFIRGRKNKISNISLSNSKYGIATSSSSSWNCIKTVKCSNVQYGIELKCCYNVVEDVNYTFSKSKSEQGLDDTEQIGVHILGGSYNEVTGIKCHRYNELKDGFIEVLQILVIQPGISLIREPCNNVVKDCGLGPVKLGGNKNYLQNVQAADYIMVAGSDHTLKDCSAQNGFGERFEKVELIDCTFEL